MWFRGGREAPFGVQPELAQQAQTTPKGRPLVVKREVSGKAANKSPLLSSHRKVAFAISRSKKLSCRHTKPAAKTRGKGQDLTPILKGKLRQNFHWKKWEGRVYINLQAYQDSIEQEFKA
ncbi:hypothetical protein EIK76_05570 [Rheinheimera mesophila]|uniref:Uncharacterized protein n=1 Tax=Rheinheimera mesophila TaxID=1547515 RepID=A0A3P3QQR2_9GAMM|nr:hypothetical protein [Rheinheimera mesophila]KKL03242.1 hypothetical protein SD53_00305 [Rheinheimera mesophila]RRJ23534.1 hypothetical protein EIK76_05570 [Rheinheimera mesophila]